MIQSCTLNGLPFCAALFWWGETVCGRLSMHLSCTPVSSRREQAFGCCSFIWQFCYQKKQSLYRVSNEPCRFRRLFLTIVACAQKLRCSQVATSTVIVHYVCTRHKFALQILMSLLVNAPFGKPFQVLFFIARTDLSSSPMRVTTVSSSSSFFISCTHLICTFQN